MKINTMLKEALMSKSRKGLYELEKIFYGLNRADEFRDEISRMRPDSDRILHELDLRRTHRWHNRKIQ